MPTADPLWTLEQALLAGRQRPRLQAISLVINRGVTAVLGWSGAGKTSLLNLLVGFEQPDEGEVRQHQMRTNRLPLYWCPQDDGLWAHLTVRQHLEMAAPLSDEPEVNTLLDSFDLASLRDARPDTLSRGERNRLSVARAIATGAQTLVMDEPLSHVDPERVRSYWQVLGDYCRADGVSAVFATHHPEFVLREADQVVCLRGGEVEQAGSVDELYHRPRTPEIAGYLGDANWIEPDEWTSWLAGSPPTPEPICLRPEQLVVERQPDTAGDDDALVVDASRFCGAVTELDISRASATQTRRFFTRSVGDVVKPGTRIVLRACIAMLLAVVLHGCEHGDSPQLPVSDIEHRTLPPAGAQLPAPRSMTVGPDDSLYVLDDAGRVVVYGEDNQVDRTWWMPAYDVGKPEGVLILDDGRIAVADTHYHRVVFFDSDGEVLETWGELGHGPGEFQWTVALAQDDESNIYVGEYGAGDRIQKFTPEGEYLLEFGGAGTDPGLFQRPSGMVWDDGTLYVADAMNNRIQLFDRQGKFLGILGGDKPPALHYPYDLALAPDGTFVVVEYGAGRVTQLSREGQIIGRFGTEGREQGQFWTPWGLAVNSRKTIFVADTGNRRIVRLETP